MKFRSPEDDDTKDKGAQRTTVNRCLEAGTVKFRSPENQSSEDEEIKGRL